MGKRQQAQRFALHLGVAANEKVFHSLFSRDPDHAIKRLSLAFYREFSATDQRFNQLVSDYPSTDICPNKHPRQTEGAFCPICGERFKIDKVIEILLNDSVDRLSLTEFLKNKLKTEFLSNDVRSVLKLTPTELQTAKKIGPVRARQIINAAEEYISG